MTEGGLTQEMLDSILVDDTSELEVSGSDSSANSDIVISNIQIKEFYLSPDQVLTLEFSKDIPSLSSL